MGDRFKFRVWLKKEKEMRYNAGIDSKYTQLFYYTCSCCGDDSKVHTDFMDSVLMQCTGLKDSEGKLIYEGDILETDFYNSDTRKNYKIYYEVKYSDRLLMWQIESARARTSLHVVDNPYDGFNTGFKVAGNIYENKGLLDEK